MDGVLADEAVTSAQRPLFIGGLTVTKHARLAGHQQRVVLDQCTVDDTA